MIDIVPPVTPPSIKGVTSISPIGALLKVIENLKRPLLIANKEECAYISKRKKPHPISTEASSGTTRGYCFFRERIKDSTIEIHTDGKSIDTKALASMVSMMKKGLLSFPPPTPPVEKDITAFPPIATTRTHYNGGLENIAPAFYSIEKPYTTEMILLPHRLSPECSPFYNYNPSYKIGHLWFQPLNESDRFGAGNDEMMKIAGMRRRIVGRGNIASISDRQRFVNHLVLSAYKYQVTKYQLELSKRKIEIPHNIDELEDFLLKYVPNAILRRLLGKCSMLQRLIVPANRNNNTFYIKSNTINVSEYLIHKLDLVEEVLRRLLNNA